MVLEEVASLWESSRYGTVQLQYVDGDRRKLQSVLLRGSASPLARVGLALQTDVRPDEIVLVE